MPDKSCLKPRGAMSQFARRATQALFELHPVSGRRHQLRLHMQSLGWPILNDRYYPVLQPLSPDDYTRPLQLLSKGFEFINPVTNEPRHIEYDGDLELN